MRYTQLISKAGDEICLNGLDGSSNVLATDIWTNTDLLPVRLIDTISVTYWNVKFRENALVTVIYLRNGGYIAQNSLKKGGGVASRHVSSLPRINLTLKKYPYRRTSSLIESILVGGGGCN